jgi:hypothetical protein
MKNKICVKFTGKGGFSLQYFGGSCKIIFWIGYPKGENK